MSRIEYLTATSQVVLDIFDFATNLRHVFIEYHRRLVEADRSRITFDRLLCFAWLENVLDAEGKLSDLMLDCVWSSKGVLSMEMVPGLFEMLPRVDPSTITFGVYGKEKSQGEPIYWREIGFIVVCAFVEVDCWPVIEDDRLMIYKSGGSRAMDLPDGYTPNGRARPERKAEEGPERKKPDLHVVPKHEDRKRKRARRKVSRPVIIKYFKKVNPGSDWPVTFRAMCRDSKYRDLAKDSRTAHKRSKWARIYSRGIDRVADMTGQGHATVKRHIAFMIKQKIIKLVWHGFKGQGYSRYEIPLNMSHVFAWRRKPTK